VPFQSIFSFLAGQHTFGEILADVRITIQGKKFFQVIRDEVLEKEPFCFKNDSHAKTA
jgi:hypothetical protein